MGNNKPRIPDENREQWLDAALSARMGAMAEPRSGLEERILARLASEAKPKPTYGWALAFIGVAAAMLIAAALLIVRPRAPEIPSVARIGQPAISNPAPVVASKPPAAVRRPEHSNQRHALVATNRPRLTRQKEITPKLETFPAPTPETETERALAALADSKQNSDQLKTLGNFVSLRDLQISPIDVPTLRSEDEGASPQNSQN